MTAFSKNRKSDTACFRLLQSDRGFPMAAPNFDFRPEFESLINMPYVCGDIFMKDVTSEKEL